MPRLSIIVPHRQDDLRLEATLVSILENRPNDCEIVVVHDGSYRDPYHLGDEVVFVQESGGVGDVQKLNAGVLAACAPIVNLLMDGTLVQPAWTLEPLKLFNDPSIATVATTVQSQNGRCAGILPMTRVEARSLQRGRVEQIRSASTPAGPAMACGFYRRRQLLALGGWNADLSVDTADVEMAWLQQTLGLSCESAVNIEIEQAFGARNIDARTVHQLASIGVAFGLNGSGLASAAGGFMGGMLTCGPSAASAWARGILDNDLSLSIAKRINAAAENLRQLESNSQVENYESKSCIAPARRAA
ncbi:MAG: glycosyltransferase [Planctomycetales bacterium]|nr:glycosyltransferase [Planctomycetales bacterium]